MYHAQTYHFEGFPAALIVLAILAVVGSILLLGFYVAVKVVTFIAGHTTNRVRRIARLEANTVITEYDAPDNLSPAEVGYLFDTNLKDSEVYATIVQLQQKGYITLVATARGLRADVTAIATNNLDPFDKAVLGKVKRATGHLITESFLRQTKTQVELTMNKQLRDKGYLLPEIEQIKRCFPIIGAIGLALFILFPVLVTKPYESGDYSGTYLYFFFSWPVYFGLAVLVYMQFKKIAGEPWLAAPKLKKIWPAIEGFRTYIQQVELDNMQFESGDRHQAIKNDALPYAIALDFNTGWRQEISK